MRIAILKSADAVLGQFLVKCLPRADALHLQWKTRNILVLRPGGIGDAVHIIPAIQKLQNSFPGIAIDILAERRNAGAFALCLGIRRVYLYDRPGQLLNVLRNRYDVVVDSEQWHRLSAVVARLVRAPVKIGYATNERARLFTHAIPYSHDDYEVDSFLHLLAPLGIKDIKSPAGAWLQVPVAAQQAAEALVPVDDLRPLAVLFPGASIAERRWGVENFRTVAQYCLESGLRVAVIGGGGDHKEAEQIATDLPVINLAGQTNLVETAAVLERAAVVVSGDSGILHIAVGLGRPTVSLFGSGLAAKWAPRGPGHIVLNKHLSCSPCTRFGYTPPCPIDSRCMKEIEAEEVIAAIAILLAKPADKELS